MLRHPAGLPVPLELAATAALAPRPRRAPPASGRPRSAVVLVVLVATRWPYGSLLPAWSALYLVAGTRRRAASPVAFAATLLAPLVGMPGCRPWRADLSW